MRCRRRRAGWLAPNDETGQRQVADQVLGGDARHEVIGMTDALPAVILERKRQDTGDVGRISGT